MRRSRVFLRLEGLYSMSFDWIDRHRVVVDEERVDAGLLDERSSAPGYGVHIPSRPVQPTGQLRLVQGLLAAVVAYGHGAPFSLLPEYFRALRMCYIIICISRSSARNKSSGLVICWRDAEMHASRLLWELSNGLKCPSRWRGAFFVGGVCVPACAPNRHTWRYEARFGAITRSCVIEIDRSAGVK